MKAVRYHGPEQPFRLDEITRREPAADEVRVDVTAAGNCHTELHFRSGLLNLGVAPLTMGHEIVGRIATVVDRTLTLDQFAIGLQALERGELIGRAVLIPSVAPSHGA